MNETQTLPLNSGMNSFGVPEARKLGFSHNAAATLCAGMEFDPQRSRQLALWLNDVIEFLGTKFCAEEKPQKKAKRMLYHLLAAQQQAVDPTGWVKHSLYILLPVDFNYLDGSYTQERKIFYETAFKVMEIVVSEIT